MPDNSYTGRKAKILKRNGTITVQNAAALNCRRSLWYTATNQPRTDLPDSDAILRIKMAGALTGVVRSAMDKDGWVISDNQLSLSQTLKVSDRVTLVGHSGDVILHDPTLPETEDKTPQESAMLSIKSRGSNGFRKWQALGAELSHPEAVAQAAVAAFGMYGEARDVVIATLNTAERVWETERIPAERVAQSFESVKKHLSALDEHIEKHGPNPDILPQRDFNRDDWQCQNCPFLTSCNPPSADGRSRQDDDEDEPEFISESEAQVAIEAHIAASAAIKDPEKRKKEAAALLKAWMIQNEDKKIRLAGHSVTLVSSRRFNISNKKLNELVGPETRSQIVSESESQHVRVS